MSTEVTKKEQTEPELVNQNQWLKPPVDVYENEHEWLIRADVPGVDREALHLHLDDKQFVLEACRQRDKEGQAYAGYRREFSLPSGVNVEKVTAELRQGVVAVRLPKAEALRPRRIEVKAG